MLHRPVRSGDRVAAGDVGRHQIQHRVGRRHARQPVVDASRLLAVTRVRRRMRRAASRRQQARARRAHGRVRTAQMRSARRCGQILRATASAWIDLQSRSPSSARPRSSTRSAPPGHPGHGQDQRHAGCRGARASPSAIVRSGSALTQRAHRRAAGFESRLTHRDATHGPRCPYEGQCSVRRTARRAGFFRGTPDGHIRSRPRWTACVQRRARLGAARAGGLHERRWRRNPGRQPGARPGRPRFRDRLRQAPGSGNGHAVATRVSCSNSSEGSDLFVRDRASPSSAEINVTGEITGGLGDVRDVEPSYDGTKFVFAMREPLIEGADEEDQPTWNIWEYDVPGARAAPRDPLGHHRRGRSRRRAALSARRSHRLRVDAAAAVARHPARRGQAAVRGAGRGPAASPPSCCT